jgi:hypothetical protein
MNVLLCVLVTLSLALTATGAFAQAPDTILLNGKIVTADEGGSVHEIRTAVLNGVGRL